jgi:hypothetical protein
MARTLHVILVSSLPFLAAGCAMKGAAPPSSSAPAADAAFAPDAAPAAEGEPLDLNDAALRFDQAERELAALFPGDAEGSVASGDDDKPAPATAIPEDDAPKPSKKNGETSLADESSGRCVHACRALRSMERSAARLCDLTGQDDARCEDVSRRSSEARERVVRACSRCEP